MTPAVDAGIVDIANDALALQVTTAFGPRIISCIPTGGENLMAVLPDLRLDWQPDAPFHLRGGHRLWVAPEEPRRTYTPDDDAVIVANRGGSIDFTTPATATCPLTRTITVTLAAQRAAATIEHTVRNVGPSDTTAAPWAITMLRGEGTAYLPLRGPTTDEFQAERTLVLWPYSSLADPLVEVSDGAVVVRGNRTSATKWGTSGAAGHCFYVLDDHALVKRIDWDAAGQYADHGAALQCYANADFCELETLGPLVRLALGDTTRHIEYWEIHEIDPSRPIHETATVIAGATSG